jgi:hypothetical protein
MRILDITNDVSLSNILIYLTEDEARDLRSSIDSILESAAGSSHQHISNEDYQKEISICTYDPNNLESIKSLDKRSKKIILEDI